MKQVVYFSASNSVTKIDIRHFFSKRIAFDYCPDENRYNYFYDGDKENAEDYLTSIGFKNVRILGEKSYEKMKANFTLPASKKNSMEDINFFNRKVDPQYLIKDYLSKS